jgi:hypothetical protein
VWRIHSCVLPQEGEGPLQDRTNERGICLTEEEAIGLLDIIVVCSADLTAEQRAAMLKLSDFCRQFLRDPMEPQPTMSLAALGAPYAA